MKKIFRNKKGVSEIVGTILLLGMAIALFVGVHIVALDVIPYSPNAPSVRISGEIVYNEDTGKYDTIYLQHNGGDSLPLNTKIIFSEYGEEQIGPTLNISDFDYKTEIGKEWNIGEVIYHNNSNFYNKKIQMIIIDIETNSIIAQDIFQEVN
jgi:flagellin-like protein